MSSANFSFGSFSEVPINKGSTRIGKTNFTYFRDSAMSFENGSDIIEKTKIIEYKIMDGFVKNCLMFVLKCGWKSHSTPKITVMITVIE